MNLVSDKDDHVPGRVSRALAICVLILFAIPGVVHSASPVYPLKLSADSRHLEDQAGVPFLMNGDTPWSLIVQLTKSEAEQYLEDRRARGFNTIIVELIEHQFGGPENRDGELPFVPLSDSMDSMALTSSTSTTEI